jgi:hypothetical protein
LREIEGVLPNVGFCFYWQRSNLSVKVGEAGKTTETKAQLMGEKKNSKQGHTIGLSRSFVSINADE